MVADARVGVDHSAAEPSAGYQPRAGPFVVVAVDYQRAATVADASAIAIVARTELTSRYGGNATHQAAFHLDIRLLELVGRR